MRGKTPPIHLTGMPMLEWGGVSPQSSVLGPNWLDHVRMGRCGMHTAQNGANRFEVRQNGPSTCSFHPKWGKQAGSWPEWPKWGRFFGKRGDQGPIQRAVERIAPY